MFLGGVLEEGAEGLQVVDGMCEFWRVWGGLRETRERLKDALFSIGYRCRKREVKLAKWHNVIV